MKTLKWLFLVAVLLLAAIIIRRATAQTAHSVTIQWVASTTTGAQYNVYRGTTTGGPYTKLNGGPISGTLYGDTTGAAGTHYFYVVTAICGTTATCPAGVSGESAFSAEVSATFLGNPVAPTGVTATAN
jgi:fibronectin type 3 domain-containing protein